MPLVEVYYLPEIATEAYLASGAAAVIDVLRASTTILHVLAAGAREVIVCSDIDEAITAAQRISPEERVLGGERGGVKIAGFDLGNSPFEYTPETVGGRSVIFTTTNGTRAIRHSRLAQPILIGAPANFSALLSTLKTQHTVHLVCAGTDGEPTEEDILFAGAIVERLVDQGWETSEFARQARAARRSVGAGRDAELLRQAFRDSRGGRNLVELGFDRDIDLAMQFDTLAIVPEVDAKSSTIRPPAR